MLETVRKLWKIDDLRKKIVFTFVMLLIYRLVGVIPAPGVDAAAVLSSGGSNLPLLELVNMMTGNAFSQMTIMAMGITPYINASIIMQLLTIAIPALERMQADEAGGGRQKIARITRYVTVGLAAVQAIGLAGGMNYVKDGWYNYVLVGVSMAGGSALAMWIGERITEKGVGNGISLLIFAGIISNLFNGIVSSFGTAFANGTATAWLSAIVLIVVTLLLTVVVTFIDLGERRIPLQIAKQVKGRRVYGGQNTHMSLKVVSVGVLPLIFAYSFLSFPGTIAQLVDPQMQGWFTQWWMINMNTASVGYMIVSGLLIVAFTFFYSSISFDPKKQAEQLIMQGATIPGQRGKNIRDYLKRTVNRLNLFAALFLAVLAAVPTLLTSQLQIAVPFAASSILIAVSVALESIRTVEGEMSIRGIETDKENGFM
ncbi:MAG: preprotein translocase subunit SecY [Clostridiales bacterium]|nr:preprotein translocase subunit SecY [Clostridiales bacterium]